MKKTLLYLSLFIAIVIGVLYLNYTQTIANKQAVEQPVALGKVETADGANTEVASNDGTTANEGDIETSAAPESEAAPSEASESPVVNAAESPLTPKAAAEAVETTSSPEITSASNDLDKLLAESPVKTDANADTLIRVLLKPRRETTLSSTISGRIIRIQSGLGDAFKQGSPLVTFDCDQSYAKIEIAKATLSAAIEEHEAKIKMQGLDQASDLEVALAASAVNKAKAELKLQRVEASECKIYAPFSGRIAKVHVHRSMTVQPGEPLLDVVDAGPLKAKLNVPSRLLSQLKAGKKITIKIDETGKSYAAKIRAVNSRIDSVSQTVEIEATMIKPHKELLAGMSGTADLSHLDQ